jgi:hypothetical protein
VSKPSTTTVMGTGIGQKACWQLSRVARSLSAICLFSNACPRFGGVNLVLAVGAVLWDELPQ